MKLLLDTNVVLDVLLERSDFIDNSLGVFQKAISNGDRLYFSASSATGVYYIVRKQTGNKEQALNCIKRLAKLLTFAEVTEESVLAATISKIEDYKDAVIDNVASRIKADYIITRNVDDFKKSKNNIISPNEFIAK